MLIVQEDVYIQNHQDWFQEVFNIMKSETPPMKKILLLIHYRSKTDQGQDRVVKHAQRSLVDDLISPEDRLLWAIEHDCIQCPDGVVDGEVVDYLLGE